MSVEFRRNIIMIVKSIMTRLAPTKKSVRTTSSTGNSVDLSKFNEQQKQILNRIENLANFDCEFSLSESVNVKFKELGAASKDEIYNLALSLKPWRKGPFLLDDIYIDSEWQSFIKFNILAPHLNLAGKCVADVGCNNGYYMFKMLEYGPKSITGFDPSVHTYLQFAFLNKFIRSKINYELLGVESLPEYTAKFDTIFCLGVIYHRSDPIKMLKELKTALNPGGELFLDTMYIDMDGDFALSPKDRYSKIPNIYFVPTLSALCNWCERAKFKDFSLLDTKATDLNEQRKTQWIDGESLGNFLDPDDSTKTIEGYPAPKRAYVRVKI